MCDGSSKKKIEKSQWWPNKATSYAGAAWYALDDTDFCAIKIKDPSRGPSAQSGFSAWKQSALFGFVSMELKVHTLLHLLCNQWEEHKRKENLFWEGIRIIYKNASSETMSSHCVRNEI